MKLKHWQLFFLIWGIPIIFNVFTFSNSELLIKLGPIILTVFVISLFGWIWAISTELNKFLDKESQAKLKIGRFRFVFSIPLMYALVICLLLLLSSSIDIPNGALFSVILIPIHLVCFLAILYGFRFAARTIKSVELGRIATDIEAKDEYGKIAVSFIGIWTLQPRLNKMIEASSKY